MKHNFTCSFIRQIRKLLVSNGLTDLMMHWSQLNEQLVLTQTIGKQTWRWGRLALFQQLDQKVTTISRHQDSPRHVLHTGRDLRMTHTIQCYCATELLLGPNLANLRKQWRIALLPSTWDPLTARPD